MPARNAGAFIAQAIASIQAQTLRDWELIVLEDGSTDDTASVAASFVDPRIRVIGDGMHRGRSRRLNQGVGLAGGRYIARMDADDVAFPERLARQAAYLDANPTIDLVANQMLVIDECGKALGSLRWRGASHEEIVASPATGFHFGQGTCMGRAEWFRRWPYDPRLRRGEDDDQMLRALAHSRYARLPEVLYAYRKPNPSLRSIAVARFDYARALMREAVRQERPAWMWGAFIQAMRLVLDACLISAGRGVLWVNVRLSGTDDSLERAWAETRDRITRYPDRECRVS